MHFIVHKTFAISIHSSPTENQYGLDDFSFVIYSLRETTDYKRKNKHFQVLIQHHLGPAEKLIKPSKQLIEYKIKII